MPGDEMPVLIGVPGSRLPGVAHPGPVLDRPNVPPLRRRDLARAPRIADMLDIGFGDNRTSRLLTLAGGSMRFLMFQGSHTPWPLGRIALKLVDLIRQAVPYLWRLIAHDHDQGIGTTHQMSLMDTTSVSGCFAPLIHFETR
jgi:hypothetical protein